MKKLEKENISVTNNKITFSSSSGGYDQYTEINLDDNTVTFKECSGAECWAREVTIEELEVVLEIIRTRKIEVNL